MDRPTIQQIAGLALYLRHYWLIVVSVAVVIALLFAGTYWTGLTTGTAYSDRVNAETQRLRAAVSESERTIEQQSTVIGRMRARARLNKQADQLVRTEMIQLTGQVVQLQKENSIFRKVMDPESFEKGLSIRSWDVEPSALLHHFKFELVIQQLASRHPLLNGSVTVDILGVEDGVSRSISLHQVSEKITKRNIKLRFRYFQEIRGEMALPPTFTPETIQVVAYSRGKKPRRREKSFNWMPVEL